MCDACEVAINIIESVGVDYKYYNVEQLSSEELTFLMTKKAPGKRTVPIVFVDGRLIGDIDELREFFKFKGKTSNVVG